MNTAQREKWLVNLAIAAVVLLFGDRFVLGPLVTTWKERKERIEQLDQQVIRGQALMDRESAIRRNWLEMWQTAIPGGPNPSLRIRYCSQSTVGGESYQFHLHQTDLAGFGPGTSVARMSC